MKNDVPSFNIEPDPLIEVVYKSQLDAAEAEVARLRAALTAKVWLVESCDYEQSYIVVVGTTSEVAVAALKQGYGSPYRVSWGEVDWSATEGYLSADFEAVPGYSAKHKAVFRIWSEELVGAADPQTL